LNKKLKLGRFMKEHRILARKYPGDNLDVRKGVGWIILKQVLRRL
jgi:hypothetical protein